MKRPEFRCVSGPRSRGAGKKDVVDSEPATARLGVGGLQIVTEWLRADPCPPPTFGRNAALERFPKRLNRKIARSGIHKCHRI